MKKFNINQFYPCNDGKEYYESQPDFETAWNNCERGDWMLWMAKKLNVDDRTLTLAKAYCANTVRHLMKDKRSLDAVDAAIKYGNGQISREELDKAAAAAAAAYFDASYAADAADYAAAAASDYAAFADSYTSSAADYAAAAAAADAAVDAADADAAYVAADDAADAKEENQLQTANICREYLTDEVFKKIK